MPVRNHQERRDRDIYQFVMERMEERVNGVHKYRYAAVLEMASTKFYLSSQYIAKLVSRYKAQADQETPAEQGRLEFGEGPEQAPGIPTSEGSK
ncbi:MAG TPA: hypothetical protein PKE21_13640 [Flavobacteriales bacterium]|nr:hypothetical protein [Flavobacteriales bacterium]HMR28519.1 hypothetical protein [Flavobacteriales bacterium]